MNLRHSHKLFVAVLLVLAAPGTSSGVVDAQSRALGQFATRADLEASSQTLQAAVASPAYGERIRSQAARDLAVVRQRLARGDFNVGERVVVSVRAPEVAFNDTLTVRDSLVIEIPGIRRVSLDGVLRSELEPRVAREVGLVVLNAQVSASPLLRVAVLGSVTTPGFRSVTPETTVDQLLAMGGSPDPRTPLGSLQFQRAGEVIVDGPELLDAIAAGRTLAALDLRDGDVLNVPAAPPPWDRAQTISLLTVFLAPVITLLIVR